MALATAFISGAASSNQLSPAPSDGSSPSAAVAGVTETDSAAATPTVAWSVNYPTTGHVGTEKSGAVTITNPNAFITSGWALVITFTTTGSFAACEASSAGCFQVSVESQQVLTPFLFASQCFGSPCTSTSTSVSYFAPLVLPPNADGPSIVTIAVLPVIAGTFGSSVSIVSDPAGITAATPVHAQGTNST
jgi:hypothetical protein